MSSAAPAGSSLAAARAAWNRGDYGAGLALFREAAAGDEPGARVALAKALAALDALAEARAIVDAGNDPGCRLLAILFRVGSVPARAILERLAALDETAATAPLRRRAMTHLVRLLRGEPLPGAPDDGFSWLCDQGLGEAQLHPVQPPLLRASLAHALDGAAAEGLVLEFGVYWGRSIRLLAEATGRSIHGFDSFQGLPEAWNEREGAGAYSTGGTIPAVPAHVTLHQGWFEDTLPPFLAATDGPVALAHIDCDLYSSTRTVLEALGPRLVPGTVLLFDDFLGYPGWRNHEFRAFSEWAEREERPWELLGHAFLGREVALRLR